MPDFVPILLFPLCVILFLFWYQSKKEEAWEKKKLEEEKNLENRKGVFITTTSLSDVARKFAAYSDISVVENCPVDTYPLIKCNVAKNGEKIYHLPFDQQYDRIELTGKPGCFYAWTTKEAEEKGFRRAYRWHPENK